MQNWKKQSIKKSIENYRKTGDIEHLMDVLRVYEYSIFDKIKSRVAARLKEITNLNLFHFNYNNKNGGTQ